MGLGLELLGAILVLMIGGWVGWQLYLHLWLKRRGVVERCPYCGRYIHGSPTYCPHCGEVLGPQGSSRR